MSELISGKEALVALASGEEVEVKHTHDKWYENWESLGLSGGKFFLCYLLDESMGYKFRLKPRTITINGVEVPACGDYYKPHTFMFILNSLEPCEYSKIILDESDEIPPYWWKSEEEIRQVVEALRSVFNVKR